LFSILVAAFVANAETNSVIYFEVGSIYPSIRESYVLPIFDTNQIDEARTIIRGGQPKVVAARIRKAPDEINRNLAVEGFPRWSWSVTNLIGFYDVSAEEMDGKPSLVELGPDSYVETGIGFWGFTVIRELGPIPLYLDVRRQGTNINVFWSGIATNALYTLESQAEGLGTDWIIEASGLSPAKTNQWTLPITTIPHYFRVRADGSGTN
jgi:hypothetical protein